MKERIWITVKLTIQNRVAKFDVEPNATSCTHSRSSRLHVRDVTNVKHSGQASTEQNTRCWILAQA